MAMSTAPHDAYGSIRQTAARALLEGATLDDAVAEILRAISGELDWPLALYWTADADHRLLRCRSIWAADSLKRADVVEAARVAVIAADAKDDPARQAYERREPIWIEHLARAGTTSGRLGLALGAGLESSSAFPVGDRTGALGAIELYSTRARAPDDALVALMAEVGHEMCEVFRRAEAQATALETVARSRDALDQVLAALPDGTMVLDASGRIIYANEAAARAIGFGSGAEMVTAHREEILRRFQVWDEDGRLLSPGELPNSQALQGRQASKLVRYRSHDGKVDRWASMEAVPIFDERGQVERIVSVFHDVTNQRRVELDNVRLVGEAQEAVRAREDLLAIVSHDLRNPLGVVLASTALLLKANLPPDKQERARRQVEAIQRAGNRMNRLIRDLLDFASIQAGRLSVSLRPQDVATMVNEVLEVTEPIAAPKGLRLVAEVAPGLAIRCDHDRIIQLFSNLVGNAVKFTPEGGTITVRAAPAPDEQVVRFSVSDTGPGIPADELPHVFDRYYQAQRKNREGIGLGLSIARGIVEAHGGRIWVESHEAEPGKEAEPGTGSTFFFTLPPDPVGNGPGQGTGKGTGKGT
jgi:PAS domain S-box-containing protein